MQTLQVITQNGQRVLTTAQLAESYGADEKLIQQNFNNNKGRYKEGKHYILLTGNDLKDFKDHFENLGLVKRNTASLYLWTEKGAWLHAKSLNTDEAWEAYEMLVDNYYSLIEQTTPRLPQSYKEALQELLTQVEANEKLQTHNLVLEQRVNELQPKASYYDLILQNKTLLAISTIAKDYGMSATAMNKLLNQLGIQYKQGGIWLLYHKYQDKGYTQTATHIIDSEKSNIMTKWTQKGRLFIYELLKQHGYLPLIEKGDLDDKLQA